MPDKEDKSACDGCVNLDIMRLQFKGMLEPLELTLAVLSERWRSAGLWGKGFGLIIATLLGWGVLVLGDLNSTLRDFGIVAFENRKELKDHKASAEGEHLRLSGRIEDIRWKVEAMWSTDSQSGRDKIIKQGMK